MLFITNRISKNGSAPSKAKTECSTCPWRAPEYVNQYGLGPGHMECELLEAISKLWTALMEGQRCVTPSESNFHNDHQNRSTKSEPPSSKKPQLSDCKG